MTQPTQAVNTSTYRLATFGWGRDDHQAITRGGYALMPKGPMRDWGEKNIRLSQWYDNAQDTYLSGSQHFVNLENPKNEAQPGLFSHHAVQSWSVLSHLLTPFNKAKQQQEWRLNPLTESQLPSGPTVYDSVVEKYNAAVGTMIKYQLAQSSLTPLQQEKNSKELAKHIGALSHYVADMHMPMHASRWYNWPIAPDLNNRPPSLMQGLHQFIEQEMFTRDDLLDLMKQAPEQTQLIQLERNQLKPFLLKQIEQSHLTVYTLFNAQKEFWEANPELHQQPEAYKQGLATVLRPVIKQQMVTAQQSLGSIMHLAWEDASRFVEQYKAMANQSNHFAQPEAQTQSEGKGSEVKVLPIDPLNPSLKPQPIRA
jgi:hypothetical protein